MRRDCIACGQPTILGRYVDNHLIVIDAEPTPDGDAVVRGDLGDQPTVIFGIDPAGETLPWGTVIEAGAPRYRRHECKEATR